jgi:hypothetical protein
MARGKGQRVKGRRIAIFYLPFAICHFTVALLLACVASAEVVDRVLAVVEGRLILLTDVAAAREFGLEAADGAGDSVEAVLAKLIDRQLELLEVERYGPPEPAPEVVDAQLTAVQSRFPTPQAFEAALARSGIERPHLREIVRDDLRIRAYMDQRFTAAGARGASDNDQRRQELIDEWIAGLRRRADITNLDAASR